MTSDIFISMATQTMVQWYSKIIAYNFKSCLIVLANSPSPIQSKQKVVTLDSLGKDESSVFLSLPTSFGNLTDSLWFDCPFANNTASSSSSDLTVILATVLPTILSSLLLLICVVIVTLSLVWRRRRRKYYEEKTYLDFKPGDTEVDVLQLKYREIDYNDIVFGTLLGKGAFGRVYKV